MSWVVIEFADDKAIATVTKKWIRSRNGKTVCYWPKKDVDKKNKEEYDSVIDEGSDEWTVYECRLLMHGENYTTYKLAREAELIAQSHSTMTSFERSKSAKRKRKLPARFLTDSESEKDSRRPQIAKSPYKYTKKASTPCENTVDLNYSSSSSSSRSNSRGNSQSQRRSSTRSRSRSRSYSSSRSKSWSSTTSTGSDDTASKNSKQIVHKNRTNCNNFRHGNDVDSLHVNTGMGSINSVHNVSVANNSLPSTSTGRENADKEILELRKDVSLMKEVMNSHTALLKDLKVMGMTSISVFKDLTKEVFECKKEVKKRNGLFTDLLHQDIKLPLKDDIHYDAVTDMLKESKPMIDNLIKYIATVHNEIDEEEFVRSSIETLFEFNFYMYGVSWKVEPGKVYFKKSKILHCWRESFKQKFGLKEPKRSDKDVDKFIHSIWHKRKDADRKAKRTSY